MTISKQDCIFAKMISPPFQILYEDEAILICEKAAGLMVEPDRNNHPNLLQHIKNYIRNNTGEKNPYVQHLHRLDRVTSGLVLFTKKKEHLRFLSEQFANREVTKIYTALTQNSPINSIGLLENWHRKEKKKAVIVTEETPFTEKATLSYETEKLSNGLCRWKIQLHTGKYHQIRIQLSHIGCPILGDVTYGSDTLYHEHAIALHATQLIFTHPVTKEKIDIISSPQFETL